MTRREILDSYLFEIAETSPQGAGHSLIDALRLAAERIGVTLSTVHRWRAAGCVPRSEHLLSVLQAVESARQSAGHPVPMTLDDVRALAGEPRMHPDLL